MHELNEFRKNDDVVKVSFYGALRPAVLIEILIEFNGAPEGLGVLFGHRVSLQWNMMASLLGQIGAEMIFFL